MKEINLTKHFRRRWRQRVGTPVNSTVVRQIIRNAIKLQPSRELFDAEGRPYHLLSIYWDPDLDLVIKTDPANGTAVTVMSAAAIRPATRQAKTRRRNVKVAAVLTMHEVSGGRWKAEGGKRKTNRRR